MSSEPAPRAERVVVSWVSFDREDSQWPVVVVTDVAAVEARAGASRSPRAWFPASHGDDSNCGGQSIIAQIPAGGPAAETGGAGCLLGATGRSLRRALSAMLSARSGDKLLLLARPQASDPGAGADPPSSCAGGRPDSDADAATNNNLLAADAANPRATAPAPDDLSILRALVALSPKFYSARVDTPVVGEQVFDVGDPLHALDNDAPVGRHRREHLAQWLCAAEAAVGNPGGEAALPLLLAKGPDHVMWLNREAQAPSTPQREHGPDPADVWIDRTSHRSHTASGEAVPWSPATQGSVPIHSPASTTPVRHQGPALWQTGLSSPAPSDSPRPGTHHSTPSRAHASPPHPVTPISGRRSLRLPRAPSSRSSSSSRSSQSSRREHRRHRSSRRIEGGGASSDFREHPVHEERRRPQLPTEGWKISSTGSRKWHSVRQCSYIRHREDLVCREFSLRDSPAPESWCKVCTPSVHA